MHKLCKEENITRVTKLTEKFTGEIKMIDYFEALRGLVIDDDNGTLGIIEELEKQY